MEGFLSLEQAAQQLEFSVSELTRQIEEGRVVAIVREGSPWLSTGEVNRLKRQVEKAGGSSQEISKEIPTPLTGSRLHRASQVAPPAEAKASASAGRSTSPTPASAAAQPSLAPATDEPAKTPELEAALRQIAELNKRCAQLEARGQELEGTANRLKLGLAETEATLKRNRVARGNLENEVIGLQDQLSKARTRSEALEREVQQLGAELEKVEEVHAAELRRARSGKERSPESGSAAMPINSAELEEMRQRMAEKDRLLTQEYEQRATLRSQLEETQQKYFELKALYDKEKAEWSEVLAKSVQNQNQLREQIEQLKTKHPKGWNPFRRDR